METKISTPNGMFYSNIQYEVPLFQRPYVWNESDQWVHLWEDIIARTENVIHGAKVPPHFLGAVVLQSTSSMPGTISKYLVIDGQQRLVTLQVLIHAVRCAFKNRGYGRLFRRLSSFVENNKDFIDQKDDFYVVWPTNKDRDAFRAVMNSDVDTAIDSEISKSRVVGAFKFFLASVDEWLVEVDSEEKASRLADTLFDGLELVSIVLQASENPQQIFETLNARGAPLTAVDLIKNFLFQRLDGDAALLESVHTKYWTIFEDDFWTSEVSAGRLKLQRSSLFFSHWLVARLKRVSVASEVFNDFKDYVFKSNRSVETILSAISVTASDFRRLSLDSFSGPNSLDPLPTLIYRLNCIDASTMTPLILWVLDPEKPPIPTDQLKLLCSSIESWLVRRHIVRATTKNYNRFIVELVDRLEGFDRNEAGSQIFSILKGEISESNYWPSDANVREALSNYPTYRLLSKTSLRMILEAIEDLRRGYPGLKQLHEQPLIRNKCTVEHLMPQKWEKNWPISGTLEDAARRNFLVNLIGNLTLVTSSLNSSLSNAAWKGDHGKSEALGGRTSILLTREALELGKDDWNQDLILQRTEKLITDIIHIWPSPTNHESSKYLKIKSSIIEGKTLFRQSIKVLVDAGILAVGQTLYSSSSKYSDKTCIVVEDGNLEVDGVICTSPSRACKVATGWQSANGWTFWRTSADNDVTLDTLWERHIERLL